MIRKSDSKQDLLFVIFACLFMINNATKSLDVFHLDFQKAFHKISLHNLLNKITQLGTDCRVHARMVCWLAKRRSAKVTRIVNGWRRPGERLPLLVSLWDQFLACSLFCSVILMLNSVVLLQSLLTKWKYVTRSSQAKPDKPSNRMQVLMSPSSERTLVNTGRCPVIVWNENQEVHL